MAVRDKKKQTETGFITAGDRYLFGEGTHYEIYNKLGAHPKTFDGKDRLLFRCMGSTRCICQRSR